MDFIKQLYGTLLELLALISSVRVSKKVDAMVRFGRTLNFTHPKSLPDKILTIYFNQSPLDYVRYVDKLAVRDFVGNIGLRHLLPEVYAVYDDVNEVDFSLLPDRFVFKANHGCGMTLVCSDRGQFDFPSALRHIRRWKNLRYGSWSVEPHYKFIPPKIYAEEYIDGGEDLLDYKFHCYNGEVSFVLVCSERSVGLRLSVYDAKWNWVDAVVGKYYTSQLVSRPARLDDMLRIAKILSSDFKFVRVDLYQDKSMRIYFGELTFTPATGVLSYLSQDFLFGEGKKMQI